VEEVEIWRRAKHGEAAWRTHQSRQAAGERPSQTSSPRPFAMGMLSFSRVSQVPCPPPPPNCLSTISSSTRSLLPLHHPYRSLALISATKTKKSQDFAHDHPPFTDERPNTNDLSSLTRSLTHIHTSKPLSPLPSPPLFSLHSLLSPNLHRSSQAMASCAPTLLYRAVSASRC
jgi:hypothetical protein